MSHHVRLRYDQIRRAYEQGSTEARYFLDVETGEIIAVFVDIIERGGNTADAKRIAGGIDTRYFLLPHKSSSDGYAEMEDFIGTVEERHLRETLVEAIEEKGAFRRFREVLVSYPLEEERWFTLKDDHARDTITAWLQKNDIILDEE